MPILVLGKVFGLINISYTFKYPGRSGLLTRSTTSTYHSFLELLRMTMLMIFIYIVHVKGVYYVQQYRLVKFWIVVLTARLSEIWIIK